MTAVMHGTSQFISAVLFLAIGALLALFIERQLPASPSVEFLGPAVPQEVRVGEHLRVAYEDVLRRELCSATVKTRWREVGPDGGPNGLISSFPRAEFPVVPADMQERPAQFEAVLPILAPNVPGQWFYHPLIVPGPDCADQTPIIPPPLLVTVTE